MSCKFFRLVFASDDQHVTPLRERVLSVTVHHYATFVAVNPTLGTDAPRRGLRVFHVAKPDTSPTCVGVVHLHPPAIGASWPFPLGAAEDPVADFRQTEATERGPPSMAS